MLSKFIEISMIKKAFIDVLLLFLNHTYSPYKIMKSMFSIERVPAMDIYTCVILLTIG